MQTCAICSPRVEYIYIYIYIYIYTQGIGGESVDKGEEEESKL